MVPWNVFRARRKLNLRVWLSNLKIDSYEMFLKRLKGLGVSPPTREEFNSWNVEKPPAVVVPVVVSEEQPHPKIEDVQPSTLQEGAAEKRRRKKSDV